jgi:hypothetical protein
LLADADFEALPATGAGFFVSGFFEAGFADAWAISEGDGAGFTGVFSVSA